MGTGRPLTAVLWSKTGVRVGANCGRRGAAASGLRSVGGVPGTFEVTRVLLASRRPGRAGGHGPAPSESWFDRRWSAGGPCRDGISNATETVAGTRAANCPA